MANTENIGYCKGAYEFPEVVPTTFAELAETVSGLSEADLVSEAVNNLRYRNKYPRVYKAVAAEIEKLGFPKEVVGERKLKDGTSKPVFEIDTKYIERFRSASDENAAVLKGFLAAAHEAEPLYVETERSGGGGGGRPTNAAIEAAAGILEAGIDKVEEVVAKIEASPAGITVARDSEGNVTQDSLARAIHALTKYVREEAEKAQKNALGI